MFSAKAIATLIACIWMRKWTIQKLSSKGRLSRGAVHKSVVNEINQNALRLWLMTWTDFSDEVQ